MEDDMFLSYDDFIKKYNINIDFISYNCILRSIKKSYDFDHLENLDKKYKYQPSLNIIMKSKKGPLTFTNLFLLMILKARGGINGFLY